MTDILVAVAARTANTKSKVHSHIVSSWASLLVREADLKRGSASIYVVSLSKWAWSTIATITTFFRMWLYVWLVFHLVDSMSHGFQIFSQVRTSQRRPAGKRLSFTAHFERNRHEDGNSPHLNKKFTAQNRVLLAPLTKLSFGFGLLVRDYVELHTNHMISSSASSCLSLSGLVYVLYGEWKLVSTSPSISQIQRRQSAWRAETKSDFVNSVTTLWTQWLFAFDYDVSKTMYGSSPILCTWNEGSINFNRMSRTHFSHEFELSL